LATSVFILSVKLCFLGVFRLSPMSAQTLEKEAQGKVPESSEFLLVNIFVDLNVAFAFNVYKQSASA
jgi:hypothetical protein